jgi:hypothetical protein
MRGYTAINYSSNFPLVAGVPLDKYTYDPSPNTELYTWLKDYYYPRPGMPDIRKAEKVEPGVGVLGGVTSFGVGNAYFTNLADPRRSVYQHTLTPPISAQNVMVVNQSLFNADASGTRANVMNWSPRLESTYHSTAAYSFRPDDKQRVCVKSACP